MEDKIREILKGIDKDQCESEEGWWETSKGAEFGKRKLEDIIKLLKGETKWIKK